MKAVNHRKRHVPPGPCGIWFQAQVQLSNIQNSNERDNNRLARGTNASGSRRKTSSHPHEGSMRGPSNSQDDQPQRSLIIDDMSFSSAWTAAQQELNLVTPYLPPNISIPADRHRQLRPHIPSEYALLFELQRGDHDCLAASSISKTILAMVVNVESHIHHNIWTVELKDETSSIKAWMEPTLVQQQLRQTNTIIRPGVVWKLDRVGMIFVRQEERIERMLLLRGSAIQQVWTPEQVTQNRGEDTPEQQKAFLEWLERRKALPLEEMDDDDENDDQDCPEEDEADYQDRADETVTTEMGLLIPRRLAEEEDEDSFEARNYSGVLGRQIVASTSQPVSQPAASEPRDLATASASEQSTFIPTQEPNSLITQDLGNYIQEGTPLATSNLGTQPTTQPLHDVIHPPQPKTPLDSSRRQGIHDPLSNKRPRSPKRTQSPTMMATIWSTEAPDSSFWNSMLDDNDVDSESDNAIPSPEVASQPPTVTTQKEDTISIKSTLENLGEEEEDDSDCDGTVTYSHGSDVPSMFQNSNFGAIDLKAFDDDDDDEDE